MAKHTKHIDPGNSGGATTSFAPTEEVAGLQKQRVSLAESLAFSEGMAGMAWASIYEMALGEAMGTPADGNEILDLFVTLGVPRSEIHARWEQILEHMRQREADLRLAIMHDERDAEFQAAKKALSGRSEFMEREIRRLKDEVQAAKVKQDLALHARSESVLARNRLRSNVPPFVLEHREALQRSLSSLEQVAHATAAAVEQLTDIRDRAAGFAEKARLQLRAGEVAIPFGQLEPGFRSLQSALMEASQLAGVVVSYAELRPPPSPQVANGMPTLLPLRGMDVHHESVSREAQRILAFLEPKSRSLAQNVARAQRDLDYAIEQSERWGFPLSAAELELQRKQVDEVRAMEAQNASAEEVRVFNQVEVVPGLTVRDDARAEQQRELALEIERDEQD